MTWYKAYAFCIWDGGFLPSEAEWEYAAAGGSELREYPWGSTDPGTNNQYAIYDCYYNGTASNCTAVTNVAPVGTATLGAGLWGQLDLAGGVEEWTLDWSAAYVNPCSDCAYLTAAINRVYRGGDFGQTAVYLQPPSRNRSSPTGRNGEFGVRCGRAP